MTGRESRDDTSLAREFPPHEPLTQVFVPFLKSESDPEMAGRASHGREAWSSLMRRDQHEKKYQRAEWWVLVKLSELMGTFACEGNSHHFKF